MLVAEKPLSSFKDGVSYQTVFINEKETIMSPERAFSPIL